MGEPPRRFAHYRLLRLLGKGGMGSVYLAYDERREREVALKVLPDDLADDTQFRDRFRREARIAADLEDPHVVPIHDFGEIDGRLFIDMRYVRGRDLRAIIREDGPLGAQRAVAIVDQVGQAIDAAHARGLIHRDVKPANVLVTDRDFAYLADFGIASREGETRLTHTGITVGSFTYMAPERFDAFAPSDERVDIYALGCVLHEALTGSPPFPGTTLTAQMGAHLHAPRPQPTVARPGLPPALDEVVATAMAVDPAQRYATCADLGAAAKEAVTGRPVTGPVRLPKPTLVQPLVDRDGDRGRDGGGAGEPEPYVRDEGPSAARDAHVAHAAQGDRGATRTRRPVVVGLALALAAAGAAGLIALRPDDPGPSDPSTPATLLPVASDSGGTESSDSGGTDPGSDSTDGTGSGLLPDPEGSTDDGAGTDGAGTDGASGTTGETPTASRSTVQLPAGARYCAPRGDLAGLRAYVADNAVADPCAWALNVAAAVRDNGGRSSPTMSVYSPARRAFATITCDPGPPIRCRSDGTATAWVVQPGEDVRQ